MISRNFQKVWKVAGHWGILVSLIMNRSLHPPIAPGRTLGAWVCLMAIVLLWAPLWASAWAARGMACCTGNMCAAHEHAKTNPAGKNEAPRECERHGGGIAACSMSCCHDQGASLLSGTLYVLPGPVAISLPAETLNSSAAAKCEEVLQVFAPPSPPPKASPL